MAVPYTFSSATSAIPLSQLDSNFATTITLGNTAIQLGNTVTTLNNMTLANVTVTTVSGASANAVVYTNSTGQVTANSSVIALDTSGNLGLGVTPSAWTTYTNVLQTPGLALATNGTAAVLGANWYYDGQNRYKTNGYSTLYIQSAGTHSWYYAASGTAGNTLSSLTQAMTLDASGRLMIGQTSLGSSKPGPLTVQAQQTAATAITITGRADSYGDIYFVSNDGATTYASVEGSSTGLNLSGIGATYIGFGTNGSERARIDSSGNLLVGTTSQISSGRQTTSFSGATYNGLVLSESANTSNTTYLAFNNGSTTIGSVTRSGGTAAVVYNTTSDQKLKSNIEPAAPVLNTLMQVQVRQYDWTEGNVHQDYGFIAQELEPILSGVVTKGKTEDDLWQLDYSKLTPHLVKAIQEQQAIITQLQADVAALKGAK